MSVRKEAKMNLYDQLVELQNIPKAYEKWTAYREEITHYLIEQAYSNREIAIFGAGYCNDMDLGLLVSYFEKVYLLDQDEKAMREALKQYGLAKHPRIELKCTNFTGIYEDDLRDYADALVKEVRRRGMATNVNEFAACACNLLKAFEEKIIENKLVFDTYENTVILGVHSQLLNMLEWIYSVILQTIGKEEQSVRQKIVRLNDLAVEKLNSVIVMSTKQHMIMGCEETRIGQIGSIQGALQAIVDMAKRKDKEEVKLLDETYMLWPLHEEANKCYRMRIQTLKKL